MKIQILLFLVAICMFFSSFAQIKCDCSIIPYKPDSCFNICAGNLLSNATDIDLKLVLGLNDTITNKIMKINKDSTNVSLKTYLSILSGNEAEKLFKSINSLNKEQNEYLNKPLKEKKSIMANMQISTQFRSG